MKFHKNHRVLKIEKDKKDHNLKKQEQIPHWKWKQKLRWGAGLKKKYWIMRTQDPNSHSLITWQWEDTFLTYLYHSFKEKKHLQHIYSTSSNKKTHLWRTYITWRHICLWRIHVITSKEISNRRYIFWHIPDMLMAYKGSVASNIRPSVHLSSIRGKIALG